MNPEDTPQENSPLGSTVKISEKQNMNDRVYTLKDFYFDLPEELIAQYPSEKRDDARLFVMTPDSAFEHTQFHNIGAYLHEGDLLVLNTAKVIPARVLCRRESGGLVEVVLTQRTVSGAWLCVSNRTGRLRNGETLRCVADEKFALKIIRRVEDNLLVEPVPEFTDDILARVGKIPLPPYIKRDAEAIDKERYQTVYAEEGSAAAAPTAGLHFTRELLASLRSKGIEVVSVSLDVSLGTFQPVRDNDLSLHRMHSEHYCISAEAAGLINKARSEKRKIIAVGTTSVRVLESTYRHGENRSGEGSTDIFIYPPGRIESIDALITNFHTPSSTLLMLVASFGGYERVMEAYKTAIRMKYRFFSYGDAMLILR